MIIQLELADFLDESHHEDMQGPVERRQDAIIVQLANGVTLTIHYAASDAYSLNWSHPGGSASIDTAPVHHDLATFPNHLHLVDGTVVADPITDPSDTPRTNLSRLIHTLTHGALPGMLAVDVQ